MRRAKLRALLLAGAGVSAWFAVAGSKGAASPADFPAGAGGVGEVVLTLRPTAAALHAKTWNPNLLVQASEVVRRRLEMAGVASASVTVDTAARTLTARIPQSDSPVDLGRLVTQPALLEFRYVPQLDSKWQTRPAFVDRRPAGYDDLLGSDGRPLPPATLAAVFAQPPAFTGADLKPNSRAEQLYGNVVIHFEFKDSEKSRFEGFSRGLIGKRIAIFLDRHLLMAPTVNDPIPGKGVIEIHVPLKEANTLAAQLNAPPLPVPLETVK